MSEIITSLEDQFDLRFSYKSNLLQGLSFSYNQRTTLKSFLESISEETNLEFIFIGEENVVIKSSFDLAFDANALDEVVLITEYLTAGFDQKKKDGSVTMNPNKLGILPGLTEPDILQSLQLLPGISSPGESAANLHIRGGTPDHNLILYDGIKIYHQGHLFGMISPFNPYIVEDVNVFRSGTQAQFGDRIAGVIDINSLNEVPTQLSGGAGVNFLHSDVFVKTPIAKDKVGLVLSARRSINDIANLPAFSSFSEKIFQNTKVEFNNDAAIEEELEILNSEFTFADFNAKLIIQPDDFNKISISGLMVDNSLNYANADFEGDGERDRLDLINTGISANWEYKPQGNWSLNSAVSYSVFDSDYALSFFGNNFPEQLVTGTSNTVKDLNAQLQVGYAFDENIKTFLGYELSNYQVNYDLRFLDDDIFIEQVANDLTGHNIFAEGQFTLDKFFVRGGFRTTYYPSESEFFFEPRLYADYSFSDAFKLKASAEVKNQTISQLVTFGFNDLDLGNTIWVVFDEELGIPVLNNQQYTFGFFLNKNGWKVDVEGYYKKVDGLTSLTRGFNTSTSNDDYVSGTSVIRGVDLLIKKKLGSFRTWLGYTLSKTDFEFPLLQEGTFPGTFDQRHVLSWSGSYKYEQFQFSLGWQFATGRPVSAPTGFDNGDIFFTDQNNQRLGNYHRMDLSAFYDFYLDGDNSIKARLGVSVINVYDRDNELDKTFGFDQIGNFDDETIFEVTNVGLGITPNLVFRVYF